MSIHTSSMPTPAVAPVIHAYIKDHVWVAVWHNVTMTIWLDRATADALHTIQGVRKGIHEQYPDGYSAVGFVPDGTAAPDTEARKAFADIFDDRVSRIRCMSTIIEGGGFWASGLRAAINGMRIESSDQMKVKVHTSIEDVTEWLPGVHLETTGVRISRSGLRWALNTFRNGYDRLERVDPAE
ncbi:MAG: hypothetical protein OXR73_28695 [Myxococcales bacterium]|nr:hypothetical protein [Myxococcales bacterium]